MDNELRCKQEVVTVGNELRCKQEVITDNELRFVLSAASMLRFAESDPSISTFIFSTD